jgi:hypothetical protein
LKKKQKTSSLWKRLDGCNKPSRVFSAAANDGGDITVAALSDSDVIFTLPSLLIPKR